MTEAEKAYVAGIIDGEGSIVIARYRPHDVRKNNIHLLTLAVSSTNFELIEWIADHCGGYICTPSVTLRGLKPGSIRKPHKKWNITGRNASTVLHNVLPYMVVKKEQATLALEFQALFSHSGPKPITELMAAKREWYKQRISWLNHHPNATAKESAEAVSPPRLSCQLELGGAIGLSG